MAAGHRELALPEGSRRIFDQGLPLVLEFIPAEHLLLGGGTALAARWQHRDSLDVELFTSRTTFTQAIYRQRAQFKARLEELGSGRIAMLGPDGCTFYVQGAKVEVLSFPPLTHPSRSVDRTGSPSIALETSLEILAKKLHRRMIVHGRIVPRDLYDLAYARRFEPALLDAVWSSGEVCDPQVLAAALSSFSPGWMDRDEEPVANPRFPDLRDSAVQDMLDDIVPRFSLTRSPPER